jgi:vitamin B12 transporter
MRRATLPILAAIAATPAVAQAQDTGVYYLDEITVYANTSEIELSRSGSTVEVATQEDIQNSGALTVYDFLNTLPGISVTANGGIGTTTSLRVRGSSGRYLGVYVDGIDVNDPSAPQIAFDFGSLMADDVSRIEVLKGSQSARYGSEAIAGVINITTNRATEPGTFHTVGAEYGSNNTSRVSYNLSQRGDRGGAAITFSHVKTDGFSAADENDGNTEADGHETKRLSFAGDYQLTNALTAGLTGFWQDSETDYDEFGPSDGVTPDEVSEAQSRGLRAYVEIDGDTIDHEISVSRYEIERLSTGTNRDFYSGLTVPFRFPYNGARTTVNYAGTAIISEALSLGFGADYSDEEFDDEVDQASHIVRGLYAEANWTPNDQLDVALTVRHDDHSVFGGETTGRVAAAYNWRPDVILRFAAGTGFRTPSLYELFSPLYGNRALQPETSKNIEFGIEKRFRSNDFVRATLFETSITDLIDFNFGAGGYVQSPGTSRVKGVELSGAVQLSSRISLSVNATYTDGTVASGARLNRVPETDITLNLDADVTDKLRLGLSAQHISNMLDGGSRLPDYTVANLTASYQLTDPAKVYVRVDNLLDEEYQTVRGYGTSDRALFLGVRASF